MTYTLLSGVIIMGCAVAGLFFLQFWKKSRERLFLMFSCCFWLLAAERGILAAFFGPHDETNTATYLLRFAAFALLLVGIIDKNRAKS